MGGILSQAPAMAGNAAEGFMQGQQMKDEHDKLRLMMAIQAAQEGRAAQMFPGQMTEQGLNIHSLEEQNRAASFQNDRQMSPYDDGAIKAINEAGYDLPAGENRMDANDILNRQFGAKKLKAQRELAGFKGDHALQIEAMKEGAAGVKQTRTEAESKLRSAQAKLQAFDSKDWGFLQMDPQLQNDPQALQQIRGVLQKNVEDAQAEVDKARLGNAATVPGLYKQGVAPAGTQNQRPPLNINISIPKSK